MSAGAVQVRLPPVLRQIADGRRALGAEGRTVMEVLQNLAAAHPAFALHLFNEEGAVRRYIVVIHNDTLIRACDMGSEAVRPGDDITLTNALAGG